MYKARFVRSMSSSYLNTKAVKIMNKLYYRKHCVLLLTEIAADLAHYPFCISPVSDETI
jgi:isocitrate dehydrogenase kinase/phosphatase